MSKARKFAVGIVSILPCEAEELYEQITATNALFYVGIYLLNEEDVYLYLHFKNAFERSRVCSIIKNLGIKIGRVSTYKKIDGEVMSQHGKIFEKGRPKRKKMTSRSRVVNNNTTINNNSNNTTNIYNSTQHNNINIIYVNPIGKETMEHITSNDVQEMLSECYGPDVLFRFGSKLYSLEENMNFKADMKSGYITGRVEEEGAWETHRKSEGMGMLLDNLKDKNIEAVLKYRGDIPEGHFVRFEGDMHWIYERRWSGLQEDVPVFQKYIREGFTLLSANMKDKIRRVERDSGKRVRLV